MLHAATSAAYVFSAWHWMENNFPSWRILLDHSILLSIFFIYRLVCMYLNLNLNLQYSFKKIQRKSIFTAKFVVLHCTLCKLRRDFGFFYSVDHLSGARLLHTRPAWPANWEWLYRMLKNSEGNRDGEWKLSRIGCRLLYSCKRQEKERPGNIFEAICSIIDRNWTITSNEPWNAETNKTDRNSPND